MDFMMFNREIYARFVYSMTIYDHVAEIYNKAAKQHSLTSAFDINVLSHKIMFYQAINLVTVFNPV